MLPIVIIVGYLSLEHKIRILCYIYISVFEHGILRIRLFESIETIPIFE